jgi:phosphatidate cytidylyltransferase
LGITSNLLKRVLSVVVLLPTVLFFIFWGGWLLLAFVTVVVTLATWEYVRLLRHHRYRPPYVFAISMAWAVLFYFFLADVSYLQPALAVLLFASLSWHILWDKTSTPVENWLLPLAGALYIAWTAGHVLLLRALPQGDYRLLAVFGLTWLADTGAYFVGQTWGRHRMAPRWSPNKTWEGLVGGIGVAIVCGTLLIGLAGLGWVHGAILGFLLATLTSVGDLGVSMIKRQVGVKDSGNLIPGHGGMFDRIDSLLIAAIVGYYYNVWVMGVSGAVANIGL